MNFFTSRYFIESCVIIVATLMIAYAIDRLLLYISHRAKKSSNWKVFVDTARLPLLILVSGYGLLAFVEALSAQTSFYISDWNLEICRRLLFIAVATWFAFSWKSKFEDVLYRKIAPKTEIKNFKELFYALSRCATIMMVIMIGSVVLDLFGIGLTGLLAFGGIGGLAFSWAAKDVIANLFGGMMIFINHPFSVGDWIKSPNKNFEGFVENIGWYMTQIRTFERRPTYIPNALITDAIIENPGRMYNRRIRPTIGIRYADYQSIQPILEDIRALLEKHPGVDQNQTHVAHFVGYGSHSLDLELYCFTDSVGFLDYRTIQEDILLKAGEIIRKHGAEIAFPTSTVYVKNEESSEGGSKRK